MNPIKLSSLNLPKYKKSGLTIIAGPCSAESEEQMLRTADELSDLGIGIFRAGLWKPRTHPGSFEGVGTKGLPWIRRIKEEFGMLTATEIATQNHVKEVLDYGIDIVWIGARTAVSPFAVEEISKALEGSDIIVLVKNPINPDLELWIGALQRLSNSGITKLGAIHRGFSVFNSPYYRNEPHWQIPIELRRRIPGLPILCDPSHIGGKRALIQPISQEALNLKCDGLIIESHCHPDKALSDAQQQVSPSNLKNILDKLQIRNDQIDSLELGKLREEIDLLDEKLIRILSQRMKLSASIGQYKKSCNMAAFQELRYGAIQKSRAQLATSYNLDTQFVEELLKLIHNESLRIQTDIMNPNHKD